MSEEIQAGQPEERQREVFDRYTGFRPPRIDPRFPDYAPERDMGLMSHWLANVHHRMMTQPLDYWADMAAAMGVPLEDGGRELGERIGHEFQRLINFMGLSRGTMELDKETDKVSLVGNLPPERQVHFQDAIKYAMSGDKPAFLILMSMMGLLSMDMLFFAGRQDQRIGRTGPMTLDAILPTIQLYGESLRTGRPTDEVAIETLAAAVKLATLSGLSSSQINNQVAITLNEVVSSARPR